MVARKTSKHSNHPVARVYYAEPLHGHTERCWVRCERHEGSVPVEQCLGCPHLTGIDLDQDGRPAAVRCPAPFAVQDAERSTGEHAQVPHVPIADLMTRNVLCVRPNLSLDSLIELFVETGLRAVPVVDRDGALLGVVSEADAMLEVHARPAADEHGVGKARGQAPERMRDAASIMSALPIALPENTPVARAAAVMVFEHASRVAVVSAQGDVVGMLSAVDILFWLAQKDGYLLSAMGRQSKP